MELRSRFGILLELDLTELLAVQSDVTRLIEEKVLRLQFEETRKCGSVEDKENALENDSDTDDYLLTQFDQNARDKLLKPGATDVKLEEVAGFEPINRGPDLSSPLKGTQSLPDSLGSLEEGMQIFPSRKKIDFDLEVHCKNVLQSVNVVKQQASPTKGHARKKLCLESFKTRHKALTSLNINPITKKAWILEDFRANEDMESVRRGRKRLASFKLNKFYKEGGRPPEVGAEDENFPDSTCEFENLRQRSKSPPGFGRLDFPTTQERVDDKKKSQEIIYKKTRRRFLEATCDKIPPEERQYIFKSNHLNQLVESGTFSWDENNLKIFYRK